MASIRKKQEWFDLGARAFSQLCPGLFDVPTYPCPVCLTPFSGEALIDKRLSSEHVPPKALGGRELLLTCRACNNSAGARLDADAKIEDDVQRAMVGKAGRPVRVTARIDELTLRGELHASAGTYSLRILEGINKPGFTEALNQAAKVGTHLTVEAERFSELGARVSWLRSGYLALFAVAGYGLALDPAMEIVRLQIRDYERRRIVVFMSEAQAELPLTTRRILRVLKPEWHRGRVVQFGRHLVQFPSPNDVDFYQRLAAYGSTRVPEVTTYEYVGWPAQPTFGLPWADLPGRLNGR